ncbi:hypothetical protein HA378_32930, partial [Escherichia coli]|nr:hypothetical protein [Escherichia coli]
MAETENQSSPALGKRTFIVREGVGLDKDKEEEGFVKIRVLDTRELGWAMELGQNIKGKFGILNPLKGSPDPGGS